MIKRIVLCVLVALVTQSSFGQYDELIDSLNIIIKKQKRDTVEASALNTLSMVTRGKDLDAGDSIAQEALALSLKLDYSSGITEGYTNLGIICTMRGNHIEALEYFYKTVEVYHKNNYTKGLASGYNNIAIVHGLQGNEEKSLEYYIKASKVLEDMKENGYGQAMLYNNIGAIYMDWREDSLALDYLNRSLEIFESRNKQIEMAMNYNNIGQVYENQNQLDIALNYQLKALKIEEELTGEGGLYTLEDLGSIYLKKNNTDLAIKYYEACVKSQLEKGQMLELELPYKSLSEAYSKKGNDKKALEYFKLAAEVKDSLINEDRNAKIAQMETKYQTEKKERENELLQKENTIQAMELKREKDKSKNQFIILFGAILVILITSVLFYVRYKYHQKTLFEEEKRKQEQQRYRAIIEAEENERQRIASELHDGLGQLLSTAKLNVSALEDNVSEDGVEILANSMNLIDNACSEVRTISHNMMPTALIRKGLVPAIRELSGTINTAQQLKVDFKESGSFENIEKSTEIALYRIVQEILNNMLKHSQASEIKLSVVNENQFLSLNIADNGKGFDVEGLEQSKGIGWRNIRSRVDLLNGDLYIDSTPDKGTSVTIELEMV